ncbi:MAG: 3'-5' exonuclease [Candidatus Daviesbacteria bacterium]
MDIKTDASTTKMRQRPLIFLDLESTGLQIQKQEILEIGALKVEPKKPFKILKEINIKVKPKNIQNADKTALKIVGYSEEAWKNALDLDKALDQLDEFAQDGILVGYNVSFDWAMLDKAYFSLDRFDPFYYHRLDVMPMTYLKLFSCQKIKRFSLGEICKFFKIERENQHQALDDARSTYLVFKHLQTL